ncbi:MAG: HAD family hydrolase [Candidatus Woesearchaeota archaeon]
MKKTIIFDNENVIVWQDWGKVANAITENLGIQVDQENIKIVLQMKNVTGYNMLEKLSKGIISSEEYWCTFLQSQGIIANKINIEKAASALESLTTYVSNDVIELIKVLKDLGYNLLMISNATPEIETGNKRRNNYFDLFDFVHYSHKIGSRKPEQEIYKFVLETHLLEPAECIFIDDKQENVEAAERIGMKGIRYTINEPIQKLYKQLKEKGIELSSN